jgi:hypothetical protein
MRPGRIERGSTRGACDFRSRIRRLEQLQRGGILLDAGSEQRDGDDASAARRLDDVEARAAFRALQLDEGFHGGVAMVPPAAGLSKGYLIGRQTRVHARLRETSVRCGDECAPNSWHTLALR